MSKDPIVGVPAIARDIRDLIEWLKPKGVLELSEERLLAHAAELLDSSQQVGEAPPVFDVESTYDNDNGTHTIIVGLDRETDDFAHLVGRKVILQQAYFVSLKKVVPLSFKATVKRVLCERKEPPWFPGEQIQLVVESPPFPIEQGGHDESSDKT